jgi:hypothetical protein
MAHAWVCSLGRARSFMQIPASMLKVPALFLLTLIVTLPSLYVFNALVGSRLTMARSCACWSRRWP